MSGNYKFYNPEGVYFVSFAVVEWLDVWTRNEYKDIIIDRDARPCVFTLLPKRKRNIR